MLSVSLVAIVTAAYVAALSLGFSLIFGTTRVFHLPYGSLYGGFLVLGFYLGGFLQTSFGGMAIAAVIALALAAFIQRFIYEPLLKTHRELVSTLITAVGVFTIGQALLVLPNQSQPLDLSSRLPQLGQITLTGDVTFGLVDIFGLLGDVAIIVAVLLVLRSTALGLYVRAVGDDDELAAVLGISLSFARVAAMVLGTALSLVAAFFWTWSAGVITSSAGLTAALSGTVGAFLGGIGRPAGAIVGGVILGIAQALSARYFSGSWADVVVYGVLLLIILLRPQGLLGTRLREV